MVKQAPLKFASGGCQADFLAAELRSRYARRDALAGRAQDILVRYAMTRTRLNERITKRI